MSNKLKLSKASETSETGPVEIFHLGKDEMNLAEFPITLLTDRAPNGKNVIEYQDRIFDEKTSKYINRKLTISATEGIGLPTAVDDDVVLGLIQLTKLVNNFSSREVDFSRLTFIKLLGWPDSGDSYRRLSISLKRWLSVTLLYENAWRDNKQGAWTTKGFHILDNIELNDGRAITEQGDLFPSKIVWNQVVFESFKAGYLKSIDYSLYLVLKHSIARRMYRFLSKRMYFGPNLTFDLFDLAFAHIGLSSTYRSNAAKVKEKLQPAIEELESVGFLKPMSKDERYTKQGKSWQIILVCQNPSSNRVPTNPELDLQPLTNELIKRGISQSVAIDLVKQHSVEHVEKKIEVFDWFIEKQDTCVEKNPPGYLRKSITDDYATPPGFISRAERQRQKDIRQAKEREAEEAKRRKREEATREKAETLAIDEYWTSLSVEQQAELQAKADATADPELLASETRQLKGLMRTCRRNDYIRQLLQTAKLSSPIEA